jgi:phosphate transport system permease protein
MLYKTRITVDRSFTVLSVLSIVLMAAALLILLAPIVYRGVGAYVFRGTVEHREFYLEYFHRGDARAVAAQTAAAREARQPVYDALDAYRAELEKTAAAAARLTEEAADLMAAGKAEEARAVFARIARTTEKTEQLEALKDRVRKLLGPLPGDEPAKLPRSIYGSTRWDRALVNRDAIVYKTVYVQSGEGGFGRKQRVPRREDYQNTPLAAMFDYLAADENLRAMLLPEWEFYPQYLTDRSYDSKAFGGIWPEVLGTLYLTVGAMIFAVPAGIIAAIYLVEYAGENAFIGVIRSCISTLAGVPSIVFGLFGLAFFIDTIKISDNKSVLVGALTLALLILPTIIRAAEEAVRAVPTAYKEASMGLGASQWRTIVTVILPAALPGILTGIVISMGRAAGETAPIIFTAAVSKGQPLDLAETLNEPTMALPWSVYSLSAENSMLKDLPHMQYGMVLTLIAMVLLMNLIAILLRAHIQKRLRG